MPKTPPTTPRRRGRSQPRPPANEPPIASPGGHHGR
nr:MAG TPA: hypothetical protein [Caudoviricetes sp.]